MVHPVDVASPSQPIAGQVQFSIKGHPRLPVRHHLGYWLFMNLPEGIPTQTLCWEAEQYKAGEMTVNLTALSPLRPMVEPQLTPVGAPTITLVQLPSGRKGKSYAAVLTVDGGKPPLTFSSTALPAGLSLDTVRGTIAGIPSSAGTTNVTVSVTDRNGWHHKKVFSLKIATR